MHNGDPDGDADYVDCETCDGSGYVNEGDEICPNPECHRGSVPNPQLREFDRTCLFIARAAG